ncbi:MAG: NUDIX domain-containing protein [Ruminococcaceae bacterium]|nr:NUDIX domain-containing protein [Oscillospiraceae bacterium]
MDLKQQIENYVPVNEQEEKDKALLLEWLCEPEVFTRKNKKAHFTASAWVVNPARTKVMMIYHNIYNSWAWMGGHADGETDLLAVAEREAKEESGIEDIYPVSKDIASLEVVTVNGHEKKGEYVSAHLHLNVTYIFEAPEEQKLFVKPDENSGVMWIETDDIKNKSTEKWFIDRIYSKLIKKMKEI